MHEVKSSTRSLSDADPADEPATTIALDLALARDGQASFDRLISELDPEDLQGESLLPGWTRAHVIAHIAYNARALARLVQWAQTGIENSMYESPESRADEIDLGSTLSHTSLTRLSSQEAAQLEEAWTNLPDDRWTHKVKNAQGRMIPISETIWMRARELWLHAIDLNNGATVQDIPQPTAARILQDVLTTWEGRDGHYVRAVPTDAHTDFQPGGEGQTVPAGGEILSISGTLTNLLAWATGRGHDGVVVINADGREIGPAPAAHRWI
ncbi:maleylpyruvate isomerase family mycothiol-dependent enzyme [Arthrobacter sp. ISL-95]|uniref:maleylpyruvate isomerase family mycothiol-dependent enzyme n=1 Tax=Arthrobacter sp. ISL-95 TaxID=2819116 RepID=UPI002852E747|nr:maleylpyruvate isomerase family mycothiol-dependent enzyme [Arthrobacter sp. ISL-95]